MINLKLITQLGRRLVPEFRKNQSSKTHQENEFDVAQESFRSPKIMIPLQNNTPSKWEGLHLKPEFTCRSRGEFLEGLQNLQSSVALSDEERLLANRQEDSFYIDQYCLCCDKPSQMLVDYLYAGNVNGRIIPNWRERMVCSSCQMNNRQRLVAKLAHQCIEDNCKSSIYLMEQVTPIYGWIRSKYPRLTITGSEYLGYEYVGGEIVNGIRHEDVMNLSFDDGSFDLILSNDVFEHIPDFYKASAECARVLSSGGQMLLTIPFYSDREKSKIRAKLDGNGGAVLLLPAQYHGNPVSEAGSLVFHDFGWDVLEIFSKVGFSDGVCEIYRDTRLGHWGDGQIVFRLHK